MRRGLAQSGGPPAAYARRSTTSGLPCSGLCAEGFHTIKDTGQGENRQEAYLRNAGKSKIAQPEPQVGQKGHCKSNHDASFTRPDGLRDLGGAEFCREGESKGNPKGRETICGG